MIRNRLFLKENQEESLLRVSALLPLSIYLTDFSDHAYPSVRWHWHEDFQLCLVLSGAVRLHTAGNSYSIEKDGGFFINSRFAHSIEPVLPDSSYYCVNFPPSLIASEHAPALYRAVMEPFLSGKLPPVCFFDTGCPAGVRLIRTVRQIVQISEGEKPDGWELLIQGALLCAWPDLLKLADSASLPDTASSSTFNDRLTRIMEVIHTRYQKKLTLAEIAASINLCPEECERFFKRMTDMTIFQYLLEYRITKSREFLEDPSFSIAEVSQNTGFSSQSYFTCCFKKIVGCTPNQYRKR